MKFIGAYTVELKEVMTASAVSGLNAIFISDPGWGKTEMAVQTARDIYGDDHMVFVEIDPSTPPEVIRGAYDPAAMLKGEIKRILDNTPYDPDCQVCVLDELWRGNEVLFDALVHATSMKLRSPKERPVFWATSNFVGTSTRTEALRDRFAIWYWMDGQLDVAGMTTAHLQNGSGYDPDWKKDLPDAATVARIRNAIPGPKAQAAIVKVIENLAAEAAIQGFAINPRRLSQWAALLFGYGMYLSGSDDFDVVPDRATRMLKFCFPCAEKSQAAKWAETAISIVDKVGAAIEAATANAVEKFREVSKIKDASERSGRIGEIGDILADTQKMLKEMAPDDPRVKDAIVFLTDTFGKAVSGKPL